MINWREYPFVRLLVPLVMGIMSSFLWTIELPYFVFIILSLPILGLTYFKVQFRYRYLYGFFITLFFFAVGNFLSFHADESRRVNHYHHFVNEESDIVATITEVRITAKSYRVELAVEFVNGLKKGQRVSGKLLSYIEQSKEAGRLRYGDQIYFSSKINPIEGPQNPEAFNLKNYLSNRNIHYQTYLKNNDWKLIARDQGNFILAFSIQVRDRFLLMNWLLEQH